MVFFILCIAVVNLALGYGVALHLHGHGDVIPRGPLAGLTHRLKFLPFFNREDELADLTPAPLGPKMAISPAASAPGEPETRIQESQSTSSGDDSLSTFRSLPAETAMARPALDNSNYDEAPRVAIPASEATLPTARAPSDNTSDDRVPLEALEV